MAAVMAMPAVLNGHVTIHIAPGTYKEEIVLSRRQRNGPYYVVIEQDTASPVTDTPSVVIAPPDPPCAECFQIGIVTLDEIVRIAGVRVEGFRFVDNGEDVGEGILATGSTNVTLANVVVSDNHTGIRSTDGHFLELEAGCRIEDNDIGVESSDHGSLEINAPVSFCGNGVASLRSVRNSWITIDGDVASCVFCVGDGSVEVETLSSVQGTPCADLPPCTVTPPGTGFCIGARLPDHLTSQYLLYTIFVSYNLWGRR